MKKYVHILLLLFLITIISCSPKVTASLTNPQPELTFNDKVALLDVAHKLPEKVLKVGDLRYQDRGFTTDCSFNSLMTKAMYEAKKNGANIVKVIKKTKPDLWSTCYRLKIELYKYDGDVTSLPQYKLTLD